MNEDVSLRAKWGRYLAGIGATRRNEGLRAALLLGLRWGASFITRQISARRDRAYDRRLGLDTIADRPGLELPQRVTHDDAVYYARISPRKFAKMLKDLPPLVDPVFIDLGCGKGAALLLALEHGFRSVVGVELNDRLAPIARRNLAKHVAAGDLSAETEIVHGDVVDFRFPASPSVVYLYNPFGPLTLGAVLRNLEKSLREHPRELVVAYVSPQHADVLDGSASLERLPSRSRKWVVYRARTGPASQAS